MSSLLESVIIKKFHDLDKLELYKIMQLRIDVFVVEQDCPYQDLDGLDEIILVNSGNYIDVKDYPSGISINGFPIMGHLSLIHI